MGARTDIERILVIGSGPIVIGQACEFDYSGTQACRVLAEEGYEIVLVNSNPATIMTDPQMAWRTYVEPITPDVVARVIERERPQALLPTLGGQTALNVAMALVNLGALESYGVELIGASAEAIRTAENRDKFKAAMTEIGLAVPASGFAHDIGEALEIADSIGYPIMIRPSFILGGEGTGIAPNRREMESLAARGLDASPVTEILVERSITGWKEFELEVMRDRADNCVVVCSIENLDPMGVHTGDSITVAPAQTLSDVEYQIMRDAAFSCIRRVGVETGGSNIQFAVDPSDGTQLVIEMNPRVSRSSALASKATGFPIAKIAARLAVGYTLDEITNDITKATPASFEPTIDYVVTKVPRFAFEKLPGAKREIGTSMQSVGEVMAIGRTFPESLQKALRALEQGHSGLLGGKVARDLSATGDAELLRRIAMGSPERIFEVAELLSRGVSIEVIHEASGIDPWFIEQMSGITTAARSIAGKTVATMGERDWRDAKQLGFSDVDLARMLGTDQHAVRDARLACGVRATFKTVDTCAAEFAASTPYYYATYEEEDESALSRLPRVVILGSGPNRIGQGIEFDYCCVHAAMALHDAGYEAVMVNCNPETVSTDYDTSDRLYFEPLTGEDLANVLEAEGLTGILEAEGLAGILEEGGLTGQHDGEEPRPSGVMVGLGGQTPLELAAGLDESLVLGTAPRAIDTAEDRERWNELCSSLAIEQPPGMSVTNPADARIAAREIGYPVLVRPSYVLGGRAMEIVYDADQLERVMGEMFAGGLSGERPVLIDRFLEDATEVDVDALRDREGACLIAGVMEHVEEAGVHSGDSACALPPQTLDAAVIGVIEDNTVALADALDVRGPLNVQYAVKDGRVFVLEANPRASRTLPFVAKATGVPVAKCAARLMAGSTWRELLSEGWVVGGAARRLVSSDPKVLAWLGNRASQGAVWAGAGRTPYVCVKEAVLPFQRFPAVDTLLGPEMRSTGEVMGIDATFALAFAKSQMAAGSALPNTGLVFLSLADRDKPSAIEVGSALQALGFEIAATEGTAAALTGAGVAVCTLVAKVSDAGEPSSREETGEVGAMADSVELLASGKLVLVINTPRGQGPRADGWRIRQAALAHHVPCITTMAAARAAVSAIAALRDDPGQVVSLQEYHRLAGS